MAPHERLSLCIFMFAIITLNPFGSVLSKFSGYSNSFDDAVSQRTILSMSEYGCMINIL